MPTLTVTSDHKAVIDARTIARAGEMGVVLTVNVDAALQSLGTGKKSYVDFQQADGNAYYAGYYDCSSGTFNVTLGVVDTILTYSGEIWMQFVLRDDVPPTGVEVWKSEKVRVIVEDSINATLPASYVAVPPMTAPTTFPATNVIITDLGSRYTATEVENALQEIAGSGRTTENVKTNSDNISILSGQINDINENFPTYSPNGTDDTAAIAAILADNGGVRLTAGTFICTKLTIGAGMRIIGDGINRTIIKLKDNTNTDLLYLYEAAYAAISDLTLDGNKANNTSPVDTDVSLIHIKNSTESTTWNLYMDLHNILLNHGCNNGLYIECVDAGYSWVYHLYNFFIMDCEGYGLRDESTDNRYANFYISDCKKADILLYYAASNEYVNFKCDNGGVTNSGLTSQTDGANIICVHVGYCQFMNFDSQSAYYVGIKYFSCTDINTTCWISDNGQHWEVADPASEGYGLVIYDSYNITGTLIFTDDMQRQTTDLYINSVTQDCSFNCMTTESTNFTPSTIVNLGLRCSVTCLEKLDRTTPKKSEADVTYYVDYSSGSDSNNGLAAGAGHAFKTINYALSRIPQIVNHAYIINVASVAYPEDVLIAGFSGKGSIALTGGGSLAAAANYVVQGIEVRNCAGILITVQGFLATRTDSAAFLATNSIATFVYCSTVASGGSGFQFVRSTGNCYGCKVANRSTGLEALSCSRVISNAWDSGSTGNTTGILSGSATVMKDSTQPAGTTAESTSAGGVIR